MFNEKTQFIYEKYLQLLSDFANQYADELPERTKVKFQRSLVKYFDGELAQSVKHEKFMLRTKDMLFKRALKTQKKIARLPSITEQSVNNALQTLGLEPDVTTEIMRLMLLGLSVEQQEPQDNVVEEQVDDVVEDDGITEPAPVLEPIEELVEPTQEPSADDGQPPEEFEQPKTTYWSTRRKNRTKTDETE